MGVVNSLEVGSYDLTNFDHSHSNFSNYPNLYSNWPVVRSISLQSWLQTSQADTFVNFQRESEWRIATRAGCGWILCTAKK